MTTNTIDDFWKFVDKKSDDECWNWIGCTNNKYGRFFYRGKRIPAHKFSYFISSGYSLSNKDHILHTCNNPLCVNPSHLYVENKINDDVDKIFKDVVSYKKISTFEYEFVLSCSHTVTRCFSKKRVNLPVRLMCSQCWWNSHDKNGNPK